MPTASKSRSGANYFAVSAAGTRAKTIFFPQFPDVLAPGDLLLAKSVKASFIAVLFGHLLSRSLTRSRCIPLKAADSGGRARQ